MDNTNEPKPQNESHAPDERLQLLENRLAEQQDQLRDYEKSLVERIADVDDDRRTTAYKLQRAWQTQREEIDDRLRRQTAIVLGALALFGLLIGVILFFAYRQVEVVRQPLVDEMADLKQELSRIPGGEAKGDPLQQELIRLSAVVDEISSSGAQRDVEQGQTLQAALNEESTSREAGDAKLDVEVQRLEAEQKRLEQELGALREALEINQSKNEAYNQSNGTSEPSADPGLGEEAAVVVVTPPKDQTAAPAAGSGSPEDTPVSADGEGPGAAAPGAAVVGDGTYALQLIGFYSYDEMLKFVERNDLPARVYYREDTYRGRPWYALIHSVYDDYGSAGAELSRLSPSLTALDPWIRPIRDGTELKVLETGTPR